MGPRRGWGLAGDRATNTSRVARRLQLTALALVFAAIACGAATVAWAGQRSEILTLDRCIEILADPRQPEGLRRSAQGMLFVRARETIEALRESRECGAPELAAEARVYLGRIAEEARR